MKAFGLSLVEAALTLTSESIPAPVIGELLNEVRDLLEAPVRVLPGVPEVLNAVSGKYRLVLITKGDLIHQTRKITTSGLAHHFHEVEVVNEKDPETYASILLRLGVKPEEFCMVGNSVKSDVLPLLTIGAHAVHVPYPLTWALELADASHITFDELESITDFPAWLDIGCDVPPQSLRSCTSVTRWLRPLCRINDARSRVGLMFSLRFRPLISSQIVSAVCTASSSVRWA